MTIWICLAAYLTLSVFGFAFLAWNIHIAPRETYPGQYGPPEYTQAEDGR